MTRTAHQPHPRYRTSSDSAWPLKRTEKREGDVVISTVRKPC